MRGYKQKQHKVACGNLIGQSPNGENITNPRRLLYGNYKEIQKFNTNVPFSNKDMT